MWCPKKLDFPFYDFSVIYCDFFKHSTEINKKGKDKTSKTTIYCIKTAFETAPGR